MKNIPVIGILRGVEQDFFREIMAASFENGLEAIEITMNTPGAGRIVAECRALVPQGKLLGMGTIRSLDEAKAAVDAGAMFMVTPNLDTAVIDFAVLQKIPIVAGALTPTEVYNAWRAGADLIKVFPCGALGGASYIKDLLGPFDDLPLAAVGGVTFENVGDFFRAGAVSVGVSTALFGKQALQGKNAENIGNNVKKFIDRCLQIKDGLLSAT
ncbi:MAG: bifunctional 4-hydroxy-2-oxoglutarate aldolase/2-dehydro-3-deoxy-phosphogluconate aldolase [Proteobacteria bacterium]|nr:bifunctional 4-hydroxy-2-oxoglutarate aldolase/2-dehydro-3-deoxy-phosphogluconate aldolase [Pseudomonadota bacterium]MBU1708629.1 bifunctional 4-hydroxy-2-oxoglutarate aldolase/2-dehydro-3-deoxy-phosphogluconate aldolase [Pseudomonadota bacterium]